MEAILLDGSISKRIHDVLRGAILVTPIIACNVSLLLHLLLFLFALHFARRVHIILLIYILLVLSICVFHYKAGLH